MMENTNFIENDTKVLDFMAMTETGDPEVAKKYLESAKWDVTTAVNNFFGQINVNNNIPRNEINVNNKNNSLNRNLNNFFDKDNRTFMLIILIIIKIITIKTIKVLLTDI